MRCSLLVFMPSVACSFSLVNRDFKNSHSSVIVIDYQVSKIMSKIFMPLRLQFNFGLFFFLVKIWNLAIIYFRYKISTQNKNTTKVLISRIYLKRIKLGQVNIYRIYLPRWRLCHDLFLVLVCHWIIR